MSAVLKAKTAFHLGLFNLLRVLKYRIGVKTGLNAVQKLSAQLPVGPFFSPQHERSDTVVLPDQLTAFGYLTYPVQQCPNWFYSPLTHETFSQVTLPWFQIPDFSSKVGDIKGIWEASRFDWLLDFVLREHQEQNGEGLAALDLWLNDWCQHNPAYFGPNWKCGQEASIRVMHLIAALMGLDRLKQPGSNVLQLIEVHLQRIAPTIDYAIAQDNNHGTSEATALFIGGALLNNFSPQAKYQKWADLGRKWLENRALKLIMADGGFSQYSVNYHRVMLDSYSLAEMVRQRLNLEKFSIGLYQQLQKATNWLYVLTQQNGDVPNLGANDGARLIPVSRTDYRDFRPSVQLASTLFWQHSYYQEPGSYDGPLSFFQLAKATQRSFDLPAKNQLFGQSGLITAQNDHFFIAFKLPVFKFRPSQCDALHLDLWWKGQNILRDGGTFSYNATQADLEYFSGVASHNTVQFDGHQQMPRLSRFLFGAWLKPRDLAYQEGVFRCGYRDYWGARHTRQISVDGKTVTITDDIANFRQQAILRWRLQPGNWKLEGNRLSNDEICMLIQSEHPFSISLKEGEESRYYYHKTRLPVLEVSTHHHSRIITLIKDLT